MHADRKRTKLRRRQGGLPLSLVAEGVIDYAIFTMDVDGRIDSWNPGAARMFGFAAVEAIGGTGARLFTPEDRQHGVPADEMRHARENGRVSGERWHMRKDGSTFFANGVMVPLYDTDQTLIGYAKIARDLTGRKEWEPWANLSLDNELQQRRGDEERIRGLMRRLIRVQEDERRRIARDLHDQFGQQVAGLRLKLELLERLVPDDAGQSTIVAETHAIIAKLDRNVDFFIRELRPAVLDDLGLVAALSDYVREWSANFGIPAEFLTSGVGGSRLAQEIETSLYRITQEALNNIYKHARAHRVGVMLEGRGSQVLLVIEDDGLGFEMEGMDASPSDRGIGLIGMRERAVLAGGSLDIESSPGRGTTLFVKVPRVVADGA